MRTPPRARRDGVHEGAAYGAGGGQSGGCPGISRVSIASILHFTPLNAGIPMWTRNLQSFGSVEKNRASHVPPPEKSGLSTWACDHPGEHAPPYWSLMLCPNKPPASSYDLLL